jgi:hypothetical protein
VNKAHSRLIASQERNDSVGGALPSGQIGQAIQLTTLIAALLEKMTVVQLVNTLLAFNGTRKLDRTLTLDPILRQLNAIHNLAPYFFKITFNIRPVVSVTTRLYKRYFPFRFSDGC